MICTTGAIKYSERNVSFYVIPEFCKFPGPLEERSPQIEKEPIVSANLHALDFTDAKIVAFRKTGAEQSINYVLIAAGEKLNSSIIILDHDLKV